VPSLNSLLTPRTPVDKLSMARSICCESPLSTFKKQHLDFTHGDPWPKGAVSKQKTGIFPDWNRQLHTLCRWVRRYGEA
jgi:hypothetical protein